MREIPVCWVNLWGGALPVFNMSPKSGDHVERAMVYWSPTSPCTEKDKEGWVETKPRGRNDRIVSPPGPSIRQADVMAYVRRTVRWLDPAGGTVLAHVRLYDDGKASVCVAWLDEEWGDKPPEVGDWGLEIGLETVVRIEEDGDPCPGRGKCHGCVKWCDECGDVDWTCDDPKCDAHPRISELKEDTGFMKERVDEAERKLRDRLKDFQEAEGLLREAQEVARSGQRMVPR